MKLKLLNVNYTATYPVVVPQLENKLFFAKRQTGRIYFLISLVAQTFLSSLPKVIAKDLLGSEFPTGKAISWSSLYSFCFQEPLGGH